MLFKQKNPGQKISKKGKNQNYQAEEKRIKTGAKDSNIIIDQNKIVINIDNHQYISGLDCNKIMEKLAPSINLNKNLNFDDKKLDRADLLNANCPTEVTISSDGPRQTESIHSGHLKIRQHKVNIFFRGRFFKDLKGLRPILGSKR